MCTEYNYCTTLGHHNKSVAHKTYIAYVGLQNKCMEEVLGGNDHPVGYNRKTLQETRSIYYHFLSFLCLSYVFGIFRKYLLIQIINGRIFKIPTYILVSRYTFSKNCRLSILYYTKITDV